MTAAPAVPRSVLVPTDFSEAAARALPVATWLAESFGAHLHRVAVTPTVPPSSRQAQETQRQALGLLNGATPEAPPPAQAADPEPDRIAVVGPDGDVEVVLRGDDPAQAILGYLADHADAMVCIASRARGGLHRRIVGNVTDELMARAGCPVVAVGPGLDPLGATERPSTILLAAGPGLPDHAPEVVGAWAARLGAEVVVTQVVIAGGPDAVPLPRPEDRAPQVAWRPHGPAVIDLNAPPPPTPPQVHEVVERLQAAGASASSRMVRGTWLAPALLALAVVLRPPVLLAAPVGPRDGRIPTDLTHQLLQQGRWPVLASVGRADGRA